MTEQLCNTSITTPADGFANHTQISDECRFKVLSMSASVQTALEASEWPKEFVTWNVHIGCELYGENSNVQYSRSF